MARVGTIGRSDLTELTPEELSDFKERGEPLQFGHTLQDQIGGQTDAGFVITGFYEDGFEGRLLDVFLPTFIATRATKPA